MKPLLLRIIVASGICLSSLDGAAQSSKAIVPGLVRATDGNVTGSFRVVESSNGIPSGGTGGACLVANLSRLGCRVDVDCNDLRPAYHPKGWAYCLRPKSSWGGKTCWIRPGPQADYCRISPVSPYPLNVDLALPVVDADPRRDGRPVRWLVHGCLARHDPATGKDHPGCRLSDPAKMKTWNGKATTVNP